MGERTVWLGERAQGLRSLFKSLALPGGSAQSRSSPWAGTMASGVIGRRPVQGEAGSAPSGTHRAPWLPALAPMARLASTGEPLDLPRTCLRDRGPG